MEKSTEYICVTYLCYFSYDYCGLIKGNRDSFYFSKKIY